jgi:hypothetical protein
VDDPYGALFFMVLCILSMLSILRSARLVFSWRQKFAHPRTGLAARDCFVMFVGPADQRYSMVFWMDRITIVLRGDIYDVCVDDYGMCIRGDEDHDDVNGVYYVKFLCV